VTTSAEFRKGSGVFEVVFVGDTISREALQKQENYHRTHRKGTDI
jgi:hypothetical protein